MDKIAYYASFFLFICLIALGGYCKVLKSDLKAAEMNLALELANKTELQKAINEQNAAINALKVLDSQVSVDFEKVSKEFAPYRLIQTDKCEQKIRAINDILSIF